MLVYGKFSLFLENVAVRFRAFSPPDSASSSRSGSVDLHLGARYIVRFGYFADRNSAVLPEQVENWLRKVGTTLGVLRGDEIDLHP